MSKFKPVKETTPRYYPSKSYAEEAFRELNLEYDWFLVEQLDLDNSESIQECIAILKNFYKREGYQI